VASVCAVLPWTTSTQLRYVTGGTPADGDVVGDKGIVGALVGLWVGDLVGDDNVTGGSVTSPAFTVGLVVGVEPPTGVGVGALDGIGNDGTVGTLVGVLTGLDVGSSVGVSVGSCVGGSVEGEAEGDVLGVTLGISVGNVLGIVFGAYVGFGVVGAELGDADGRTLG
jgi:hypothetical protein